MLVRRLLIVLSAVVLATLACDTGQSAAPVTVVVTVVSGSPQPGQSTSSVTEIIDGATEASTSASGVPMIQAKATTQVAIRKHPGPGCEIIGYVEKDETVNFLERTNFEPHWYQTDKLGPDNKGWVYNEYFTLLADDSIIPRVPEKGCLYCGDGVCSAEIGEACDVCAADCGVCPKCGDGKVNQTSEQCDGSAKSCPVKGSTCSSSCQCIPPTAVPKCGDGKVNQPTEQCDGSNKGCNAGGTCTDRCTCSYPIP